MVLNDLRFIIYYFDENHQIKSAYLSIKEIIERQQQRDFFNLIKEFFEDGKKKFIRAEIITSDFYFNYKLYNYKKIEDFKDNLLVFLRFDGFGQSKIEFNKLKELEFGIKDLINKNEITIKMIRNQNGFFTIYNILVSPIVV
jgi:hypothetical protein